MKLNQLAPLFFSSPEKFQARKSISSALLLLIFGVLWIIAGPYNNRGAYFITAVVALAAHAIVTTRTERNVLFLFRYFLLWVLTVGAAVAWGFCEADVFIGPFGVQYQTHDATVALVGSGILGISATSLGWYATFFSLRAKRFAEIARPKMRDAKTLMFISLVVVYAAITVYIYREGGFVSHDKLYAQDRNSLGTEFGIFNIIIFFFTAVFFVVACSCEKLNLKTLSVMTIPYFLAVLAGNRADYLMQVAMIIFVGYRVVSGNSGARISILTGFLAGGFLFFASTYIGLWRRVGSFGVAFDYFKSSSIFIQDRNDISVLSLSTGNQMLSGFYAVYAKLHLLGEEWLYGTSYVDYIFRTPPAFLGFERPGSLASEMEVAGELMQQGGIYELTEAYWNFGYLGVFVVPFIITSIFARVLRHSLAARRYQVFWAASFITIGLLAPRAVWYQTFSYWRVSTFLFSIYVFLVFVKAFRNR